MASFEVIDGKINLNKQVTKLDQFVLDIAKIIDESAKYVIISGYVAIFFGRSRASEDVDMFIEEIPFEKFKQLYDMLLKNGYELTVDDPEELYQYYLLEDLSINIWKKGFSLIRMEVKFAKKPSQKLALQNRIIVHFGENILYLGNIEAQIAYKRYILKSEKDLEDARHLEIVFPKINKERITHYKQLFESEFYE